MDIVYQEKLTLPLPTVYGPKEYEEFREILINVDNILTSSKAEDNIIKAYMLRRNLKPTYNAIDKIGKMIRCNILKTLSGLDYRELSLRIADSELYKWFAGYTTVDSPRTPSKSTLERFINEFTTEETSEIIMLLNKSVANPENVKNILDISDPISFDHIFADSTCVKADIHFPVDWVLLRDSVRTLVKAIMCIRRYGIKHRIQPPEEFIQQINSLSIQMSHARRKTNAVKRKKQIFRKMKKLNKIVESHAIRYKKLLLKNFEQTELTPNQVKQIVKRIDTILEQLPQAIKQAHERIIGERRVKNDDKILSFYDENVHVIVRGKAGAEVEFGNGLYLAEQENGLIVDWELFEDKPPSDSKIVQNSIKRILESHATIKSYTADKGFHSPQNETFLKEKGIENKICSKKPTQFQEQCNDDGFKKSQKRRAQTEGRIAIFKNVFLGRPLRSRNIEKKKHLVNWAVFTHNLWVLARIAIEEKNNRKIPKAA